MRSMYPAIALLVALAAAGGAWQALSGRADPARPVQPTSVAPRPAARTPQPGNAAVGAKPGDAKPAADFTVPTAYRGQIIRQRVRHFPDKLLALTFDDGPDPKITPQVLKALAQHDAHATFFVLGKCAQRWPELVEQEAAAGHAVGNHSYSHPSRTTPAQAVRQLDQAADAVARATGRRPMLFRPPYGITKANLCQTALQRGYTGVLWTISTADSNPIGPETIAHNAIHTPNPGDIVLMHDGAGHTASAQALPQILRELSAAGFRFVTIPELLQAWDRWRAQEGVSPLQGSTPGKR